MTHHRWSDYYLHKDFAQFWQGRRRSSKTNVLVIFSMGFDPRSLIALEILASQNGSGGVGHITLDLKTRPAIGKAGEISDALVEINREKLRRLKGSVEEGLCTIEIHDDEGHSVGGRRTLEHLHRLTPKFKKYSDVVVDISGMPRSIFFPLLAYLIKLCDNGILENLHAAVFEDPSLDAKISSQEYGQAGYIHTFRIFGADRVIWLPLLGSGEAARLTKIYSVLSSQCIEICPILPFPAQNLRRADDIVVEFGDILFETFKVTPENLLLCDERTPFDVYRKVIEVDEYYRNRLAALDIIGSVKTVVSPLSTKTLSLGILLAAIEKGLAVCHVDAGSYVINDTLTVDADQRPMEIWLAGEPYRLKTA